MRRTAVVVLAAALLAAGVLAASPIPAPAKDMTPGAYAAESYGVSIGDPAASTAPDTVRAEAVYLQTRWCPWAAGKTAQQLSDAYGAQRHSLDAREAIEAVWHGWCR